jgi:hypothetical protein
VRVPDSPAPSADAGAAPVRHHERLSVPFRWWVQGTMLIATFWLAFAVATPAWVAWSATAVLLLVMTLLFLGYGSPRIEVEDGWLRAGRARISGEFLGGAEPLDPASSRRLAGPEADLPEAHGAGDGARRPRPSAVLAGQQPSSRAAGRRRDRDLDGPLTTTPPGGLGIGTAR